MNPTGYTNYTLRTLQISALSSPSFSTVDEVARVIGVTRPHMTKIVHALGRAGYLETFRGRCCDFWLGQKPESIIVAHVVRLAKERSILLNASAIIGYNACNSASANCRVPPGEQP